MQNVTEKSVGDRITQINIIPLYLWLVFPSQRLLSFPVHVPWIWTDWNPFSRSRKEWSYNVTKINVEVSIYYCLVCQKSYTCNNYCVNDWCRICFYWKWQLLVFLFKMHSQLKISTLLHGAAEMPTPLLFHDRSGSSITTNSHPKTPQQHRHPHYSFMIENKFNAQSQLLIKIL